MLIKNLLNNGARKPETINGKSINDFIKDEINNLNNDSRPNESRSNESRHLQQIRIELDTNVNRGGGKRKRTQKRKKTMKKCKFKKSRKTKKNRKTKKHRKK